MKLLRLFCIAAVIALTACGASPTATTRAPTSVRADETPPPPPPPPTDSRGINGFGSGN